jgi:outer membrane lipoprotein-sorting protein
MKHLKLSTIALAGLAAVCLVLTEGKADSKLDQILTNMQQAAKKINKLRANLHQEKLNKQIGPPPEVYDGGLFFRHDGPGKDRVRINYVTKRQELIQAISVIGDEIVVYQPEIKQAIITTRQKAAGKSEEFTFLASPYQSVPEMKNRFEVVYKGDEQIGSASTSKLELTPKGKSAASKITLWVNQKDWFPVKYQVVETNGDVSTFVLSDIKIGGAMSDGTFKINLPSDTKILRR